MEISSLMRQNFLHPKWNGGTASQPRLLQQWAASSSLQDGSKACAEGQNDVGYLIEGGEAYSMLREISVGGAGERLGSAVKILVDKLRFPPRSLARRREGASYLPASFDGGEHSLFVLSI